MKVAVIGSGGVGGLVGGLLARAGIDVGFLARGRTLQAIQQQGLHVASPLGDFSIRPAVASSDPAALGRSDVVLVAVKTWQVMGIAPTLLPLLKHDTTVIPVQNGVEAADQLPAVLPTGNVGGGLCQVPSWLREPGG